MSNQTQPENDMSIEAMQTYKRVPTLDMVKKATGVDLDALEANLKGMDELLSDAYVKASKQFNFADAEFIKLDDTLPDSPDCQDGFAELTEKEGDAEFDKYHEVSAYHRKVETVVIALEKMREALAGVTS
jgi:hypothetical protein